VNRRNVILAVIGVGLVALAIATYLRATSGPPPHRLIVAGDVRVTSRTVMAPAIVYPTPDLSVGIPTSQTAGPTSPKRAPSAPARSTQPTVSGTLVRMDVHQGDHVQTGQVIGKFDTTLLDLGVKQAEANQARARTNTRLAIQGLNTVIDNQAKLATGRAQLATGRAALASGAAALATAKTTLATNKTKLLQAQKTRAQLTAALAGLEKQAATFPPGHVPPPIQQQIAMVQAILAKLPSSAVISAGLKGIAAGQTQVATGEAKLAQGAAQLAQGAAQLATAASALHDAKNALVNARDTLRIVARAQQTAVDLAKYRRTLATIVSPVDGIVTYAVPQGTVMMVGAPIVTIQPDGAALVDTYLTGDQLAQVHPGSLADVTYDSAPGTVLHGTVAIIGADAEYPPTSFPTNIVHMTRTVKVSIRLDSGASPPQGTPVDISIHTD